jgi:hypothetical protein
MFKLNPKKIMTQMKKILDEFEENHLNEDFRK